MGFGEWTLRAAGLPSQGIESYGVRLRRGTFGARRVSTGLTAIVGEV